MKYQARLFEKIEEREAFVKEQGKLRRKYKVIEEGIISVQKKRVLEVLVKITNDVFKISINVLLITLASIGMIAIIYPSTRTALLEIYNETVNLMINYFIN